MSIKSRNTTIITNRKAKFEYHIEERFEAGIVLTGTEVKSLRTGKASLQEAFCTIRKGELFIINMNIAEYAMGTYNNHEPARERKLLLKKKEILKLKKGLDQKGLTVVPLKLYFNDRNLVKINIGLAKGKKVVDKREVIKDRENKREIERMRKY